MKEISLFKINYLKINIPQDQEEEAKKDGLQYCEIEARWVITGDEPKRVYLAVPYDVKDSLKGSIRWDPEKLLWYTYKYQKEIIEKYKKVDLNVPFHNKDEVKELGGIWHAEKKRWYTSISNTELIKKFKN